MEKNLLTEILLISAEFFTEKDFSTEKEKNIATELHCFSLWLVGAAQKT